MFSGDFTQNQRSVECVCFWTKVVKQMFLSRDIDYRLISDALQISESEGEKCHVFGGLVFRVNW